MAGGAGVLEIATVPRGLDPKGYIESRVGLGTPEPTPVSMDTEPGSVLSAHKYSDLVKTFQMGMSKKKMNTSCVTEQTMESG